MAGMTTPPHNAGQKIVVVQTPLGTVKVSLPPMDPDGPDPVAVAMGMFQTSVESGADDPLQDTLIRLKEMADHGTRSPLHVGLLILQQLSESGMLPPVVDMLVGTGVTEADLHHARANVPKGGSELLTRIEDVNLN
jgi:hypothetical protein